MRRVHANEIAGRLGVTLDPERAAERSFGARVWYGTFADGGESVVKITDREQPDLASAARRELAFYRDLATSVPVATPRLLAWSDESGDIAVALVDSGHPTPANAWTPEGWARLARDLARVHSTVVGEPEAWRSEWSPFD